MKVTLYFIFFAIIFFSCSDDNSKEEVAFDESKQVIDTTGKGESLFKKNCIACHHRMAEDSLKIEGTKKSVMEIKKILSDSVTHNGLSFLTLDDIALIKKYLNRGAQY